MLVLVLVQAGCSEVYVAQRGGVTPILVLHRETGAFVRAFGRNATSQQSLTAHVHGLSWSAHGNTSLWATDAGWLNPHKVLGFDAQSGELVTTFGVQGTGVRLGNTKGYSSTDLAMGFANVREGTWYPPEH